MSTPVTTSPGRPRCANCKHDLSGLTESSKCPECGRPLVEVLVRDESALAKLIGRRYTSRARLLGVPAISVAYGIGADGKPGHARGWIALGDRATGVVAVGGFAMGGLTIGGASIGLLSFGGLSVGLLSAIGGFAVAPLGLASGGCAMGLLAHGGLAIGIGAVGGFVVGVFGIGPPPSTFALHALDGRGQGSSTAEWFFQLFGPVMSSPRAGQGAIRAMIWQMAAFFVLAMILTLPAFLVWSRSDDSDAPTPRGSDE